MLNCSDSKELTIMTEAVADPVAPAAAPSAMDALGLATPPAAAAPVTLTLPGKDAKPEDWAAFYDSVGAPKTGDAYQLDVPEGGSKEFATAAAGWMAKARLTPDQAKALSAEWNAYTGNMTATQAAAAQQAETDKATARDAAAKRDEATLSNEWGATKDANMEHAKRAAREFVQPFAGEKTPQIIDAIESAIGYAATMKLMHAIGSKIGEAQPRGLGEPGAPAVEKTGLAAQLQAALDKSK